MIAEYRRSVSAAIVGGGDGAQQVVPLYYYTLAGNVNIIWPSFVASRSSKMSTVAVRVKR